MKEIYGWASWFRELSVKIAERGETGLIEKAKEVDWGEDPALLRHGDQGIDPFSFFYYLAQKNTRNQRPRVYPSVSECFELKAAVPDPANEDFYTFPTPIPTAAALFHNRRNFSPELLWTLFRQAVEDQPHINPTTFRDVLKIPYVAPVKLTHALCLVNPASLVSHIFRTTPATIGSQRGPVATAS